MISVVCQWCQTLNRHDGHIGSKGFRSRCTGCHSRLSLDSWLAEDGTPATKLEFKKPCIECKKPVDGPYWKNRCFDCYQKAKEA